MLAAGCADTVSLAMTNGCEVGLEVLSESIRLISPDAHYHSIGVGQTGRVLETDPEWPSDELRVRRAGSDEVGHLIEFRRSDADTRNESFDFVVVADGETCELVLGSQQ